MPLCFTILVIGSFFSISSSEDYYGDLEPAQLRRNSLLNFGNYGNQQSYNKQAYNRNQALIWKQGYNRQQEYSRPQPKNRQEKPKISNKQADYQVVTSVNVVTVPPTTEETTTTTVTTQTTTLVSNTRSARKNDVYNIDLFSNPRDAGIKGFLILPRISLYLSLCLFLSHP